MPVFDHPDEEAKDGRKAIGEREEGAQHALAVLPGVLLQPRVPSSCSMPDNICFAVDGDADVKLLLSLLTQHGDAQLLQGWLASDGIGHIL